MTVQIVGIAKTGRPGLPELAEAEALRIIAALVPGSPDYRAERRGLVVRARCLRTALPRLEARRS
jgi:hypothetical protein